MKALLGSSLMILMVMLAGCGATSGGAQSDEVQDIRPGEKSVIQPPQSGGGNGASRIEERNI